jgi:hypothetical protein
MPASHFVKALSEVTKVNGEDNVQDAYAELHEETGVCDALLSAAYNRAEYLRERRVMMNQWADLLGAMAGGNIIPLKTITNS